MEVSEVVPIIMHIRFLQGDIHTFLSKGGGSKCVLVNILLNTQKAYLIGEIDTIKETS